MPHILGTQHADWKRKHGNIDIKQAAFTKNYIEDHQLSQVPDDYIENFRILYKNNDVTDLKIIEAILIEQCNLFINVKYNKFSFFSNLFK